MPLVAASPFLFFSFFLPSFTEKKSASNSRSNPFAGKNIQIYVLIFPGHSGFLRKAPPATVKKVGNQRKQ